MKKLMIGFAAVALAMGVQAATVNWSTSTGVENDYEGFVAYCYLGDNAGSSLYGAVALATAAEAAANGSVASGYISTMTLDDFGDGFADTGAADSAWGEGTKVNAYAILFNADDVDSATQYMVLGPKDITFGDTADEKLAELDVGSWKDISSGPGPEPVPEPTSGLLLLLGVAGLALRRKQK